MPPRSERAAYPALTGRGGVVWIHTQPDGLGWYMMASGGREIEFSEKITAKMAVPR